VFDGDYLPIGQRIREQDNKYMGNVFAMGNLIVVKHKTMGNSKEAYDLGPMTMELALWLEYKLREHEYRLANDTDNLAGIQYYLKRDPYLTDLVNRSKLAAYRGYNPRLVDSTYNTLTPLGLERARQASIVITEINQEFNNIVYVPAEWVNLDEMFVTAGIPIRIINMLRTIHNALIEAQSHVEAGNWHNVDEESEQYEKDIDEQELALQRIAAENRQKAKKTKSSIVNITTLEDNLNVTERPEEITVKLLNTGAPKPEAWVPTAPFGQRGRNDLNVLVKYGLIDLRSYLTGDKGRPKHIIKPARNGLVLLENLEKIGLL